MSDDGDIGVEANSASCEQRDCSTDMSTQNAAEAAQAILDERQSRLGPPSFVFADQPNRITNDPDDPHSVLKILDTFSVANKDAAELLLLLLASLEEKSVRDGDLGPTNGTLALVHALEPRDAVESMLVSEMVGTHILAMECLRRAQNPDQTFAGRDVNLRHAERLMRIYAQQVDTLNKHRGKGQQKVTVEHVTVNDGGQAIVGNVEAGE
jgi:hypothetical protein